MKLFFLFVCSFYILHVATYFFPLNETTFLSLYYNQTLDYTFCLLKQEKIIHFILYYTKYWITKKKNSYNPVFIVYFCNDFSLLSWLENSG